MSSLQYQGFLDEKVSPTPIQITPVPYDPNKPLVPGTIVDKTPAGVRSTSPSPAAPDSGWFGGGWFGKKKEKREKGKPLILPNGLIVCDSTMVKKIPDIMYVPAAESSVNTFGKEVEVPLPYTFTGYMSGNCVTVTITQNDNSRPEETYVIPTSGLQLSTE